MSERPRGLDLYCKAGGATRGYQLAGFHMTGVDIERQPRYVGDVFVQADALEYVREHGHEYDFIHASPPCQAFCAALRMHGSRQHDYRAQHPDLIEPTRRALNATGKPWVMENVPGAPMQAHIILCGAMFPPLRVYRHRLFEFSDNLLILQPPHPKHTARIRKNAFGFPAGDPQIGEWVSVSGSRGRTAVLNWAMGIDWMTGREVSNAIPPAYTRFIGEQLLRALYAESEAA